MKFRELEIGNTFDWLNDEKPMLNSFYLRCVKTSARGYADSKGTSHKVGSINAEVFHVEACWSVSEQTVYVASAWWHDCDPFVSICGNSPKHVEKAIMRAMRDAATDAYNESEPEDKRKVRDYLDNIGWSGVNAFQFDAIIPQHTIDRYEPGFSGGQETVTHDSEMDYFDYEALRRGDKDAIVYLPC
jgi:hypothetical protein